MRSFHIKGSSRASAVVTVINPDGLCVTTLYYTRVDNETPESNTCNYAMCDISK